MTNRVSVVALGLVAAIAVGCEDALVAENLNNPERERVFALPASIEQILGSGYQLCRNTEKNNNMTAQLAVMSGESYSALNNFNMGPRDAIPRAPIQNSPAASQALYENFGGWSRQSRLLALSMAQLDSIRGAEEDGAALSTAARDNRARAIGFFNMGCTLGYLSLTYDSAAIVDHTVQDVDVVPELSGYADVNAAALAFLDSAIAIGGASGNGFPAEALWFGGNALGATDFVKLARSFKARFRAEVARSKAERDAVDWAAVAADADAGITADFLVQVGGSTGWNIGLQSSQFHVSPAWAQLTMLYNGMADTSGTYDQWLATPALLRSPLNELFVVSTPDKRWPQGTTFTAQRTAGPIGSGQPPSYTAYPYFRVRASGDWSPGDPWGESWYSSYRYKYIRNNSSTGPFPDFLTAEVKLLAAEAYMRPGSQHDMTKALARLNVTRTAAGLPALSGTSMTDLVPGSACVPRVPQPPDFTSTSCGTIFEALKYEWRMEMAYNRVGAWFFAMRGWEDLVAGTPLFYPVPFEEMGARQRPYYNVGGGGYGTSPVGTYKF